MKGILTDSETGDLMVRGGSLVVGDNTAQVAETVLLATPGEFKEFPLLGAGACLLHHSEGDPMWAATARDMLRSAGVPVGRVVLEGNEITIE